MAKGPSSRMRSVTPVTRGHRYTATLNYLHHKCETTKQMGYSLGPGMRLCRSQADAGRRVMRDPTNCLSVTGVGISLARRPVSVCRIMAVVRRGATFKVHKQAVLLSEARNDWNASSIAICTQSFSHAGRRFAVVIPQLQAVTRR